MSILSGTVRILTQTHRNQLTSATEFISSKKSFNRTTLRDWLGKFNTLLKNQAMFIDQATVKDTEDRLAKVHGMMQALGMDTKGKVITRECSTYKLMPSISKCESALPKVLVDALIVMSKKDLADIRLYIFSIYSIDASDTSDLPIPGVILEWGAGTAGTEYWKQHDEASILQLIGASNGFPGFVDWLDVNGELNSWDRPQWVAEAQPHQKVRCELRWHQLVGIVEGVKGAFAGRNILLMDQVGLGKTLQIAGIVALLAFCRHMYDRDDRFPGIFGKCRLHSRCAVR